MAKERIFKIEWSDELFYLVDLESIYAVEVEKDGNGSYKYIKAFTKEGRLIEIGKDQAEDFVKAWLEIKR